MFGLVWFGLVFSWLEQLPSARGGGASVLLGDRYLHFAGGAKMYRVNTVKSAVDYDDHWVMDLENTAAGWTTLKPLPLARNHMGAAALNGYFYAMGGQLDVDEWDSNQQRVDRYNPATDSWARMPDIPIPLGSQPPGVLCFCCRACL